MSASKVMLQESETGRSLPRRASVKVLLFLIEQMLGLPDGISIQNIMQSERDRVEGSVTLILTGELPESFKTTGPAVPGVLEMVDTEEGMVARIVR